MKEQGYKRMCGQHTAPLKDNYYPDARFALQVVECNQTFWTRTHIGRTEPYDFHSESIEHTIFRYVPNLN